jgi:hypothetical protein
MLNSSITNMSAVLDAMHVTAVAAGNDSIPFSNANTGSKVISYPAGRFSSPPVVMVITAASSINWIPSTGSINANNFTCYLFRRDGSLQTTTIPIQWLAVLAT